MIRRTFPLAISTVAGYSLRSSSTTRSIDWPSAENSGDDTERSRAPVRMRGAELPSAGTIPSFSWLYCHSFSSSPSVNAIHLLSGLHAMRPPSGPSYVVSRFDVEFGFASTTKTSVLIERSGSGSWLLT